ncbi:hypothetical protein [Sphingopyxis sp. FD7]|jgi:hypothetical protein|uniref:hypothetical protein n=1 Tax=Sphingopyxis sp. FD7 TaxID=1914525 RepID=UPI000DC61D6C|nr:hypothetical protein [Sphingopyxis sp. FD7]BBB13277.1 hypothetical protein SPYCA_2535 [Sphingopyxis sp. FD7]
MTRTTAAFFATVGLLSASAALAADQAALAKAPSAMTPTEIKAHNEGLTPTDPAYIKCRKTLEIGSLVKKNRVCHTNEQWKEVSAKGNQNARDTAEAMTSKAGNSN